MSIKNSVYIDFFLITFDDSSGVFDCRLSGVIVIHVYLIQISEGFYYLDTVLGKYCGNTSLPPVISKTNIVYVWWKTDFYMAGKEFVLKFRSGKCDPYF